MQRILKPHILMQWTLSNGEEHTFQLSVQKFHMLRQRIAKLLLDVINMENNGYLKSLQTQN